MSETQASKESCCAPTCCGGAEAGHDPSPESLVLQVRERYSRIAEGTESGCCGGGQGEIAQAIGYTEKDLSGVPDEANLGVGCGAPIGHLGLRQGETVVDLGSGGGLDSFIAAPLVGPQGRVIGIDMTPAMLEKARRNAAKMALPQVEFREGRLEALPLDDASVDAVTSNCVINLVPDKGAVFVEISRVLRPGGRMVVSDIILDGALPERIASSVFAYVGCVSGALERGEYFRLLRAAGLGSIEVVKDTDYLSALAAASPESLPTLALRLGVDPVELQGKVRSVTYRATKA
jgi:SAM-dependent methyltransferase